MAASPPAPASRSTAAALRVGPGGEYAFGFGRDHGPEAVLTVTPPGGRTEAQRLVVARREWQVQSITGLPPAQVTPDAEALKRITAERERLAAARATDSARRISPPASSCRRMAGSAASSAASAC